jgi:dTMP kinase
VSDVARFVVLEGGDATGKSTQVHLLAQTSRTTTPIAEALLMAADRAEHVAGVVRPAMQRGAWVVSDRFEPSSLAYQGVGRGLGVAEVGQLNELATAGIVPDLVVVLDLAPEVARERLGRRDRMEGEGDAFALAVHEAYRDLARSRGWALVDAAGDVGTVADAIWAVVEERLSP